MTRTKRTLAAVAVGGALAAVPVAPALAAGPVVTGGLVDVTVTNLLNNDTILSNNNVGVGVAANVAANVCGIAVNVLATQLASGQNVNCTNPNQTTGVSIIQ
jgi:hypothetical protein